MLMFIQSPSDATLSQTIYYRLHYYTITCQLIILGIVFELQRIAVPIHLKIFYTIQHDLLVSIEI